MPETPVEYLVYFAPLVVAAVALAKLYLDSTQTKRSSMITSFSAIMDQIGNKEIRECRDKIRKSSAFEAISKEKEVRKFKNALPEISDELEAAARNVAITYDRLAFIIKHDRKLEKEIFEMHGDVIAEMWIKIRPYVLYKWATKYKRYTILFQDMGDRALLFEQNHPPKNREP